jgi:alanine-glyoxylate transaminase/serine-glyoxylate transaminase/serine-pyruvate transaminase
LPIVDYREGSCPVCSDLKLWNVGTGAWESALTNTLSPGDKIISWRLGQFSLLWIDQQQRLGFDVDVVDIEWGAGIDLDHLKGKLLADKSHSVKALAVVHNETSTGVTNDIAGIRRVLGMFQTSSKRCLIASR